MFVPQVLLFSRGNIGLLASWAPGAVRLLQVAQRHGRVTFPLGASLSLGFSVLAHVLQGSAVALVCFSRALGAIYVLPLAFSGSSGATTCGVAPACFIGLRAWAGGALMVRVRDLLSSWFVSLPTMLPRSTRGPTFYAVTPRELIRGRYFG